MRGRTKGNGLRLQQGTCQLNMGEMFVRTALQWNMQPRESSESLQIETTHTSLKGGLIYLVTVKSGASKMKLKNRSKKCYRGL